MKIARAKTIINNLLDQHPDGVFLIVTGAKGALGAQDLAAALALSDKEMYDLISNNLELREALIDRIIERAAL